MSTARALVRAAPVVIGWLAIILFADLALGALVHRMSDGDRPVDRRSGGRVEVQIGALDPRAELPAYADSPWGHEYWSDFTETSNAYVPYLHSVLRDLHTRYINSSDGVRRTYRQADAGDDSPVLWFFGGSTTWGEGQRDNHTIPSEVARLAEDAGLALRVVNFGRRSYVSWQEVLLFEQQLAVSQPPDLVVFLDGANDIAAQLRDPSWDPTLSNINLPPEAPVPAPFTQSIERHERTWTEVWADTSAAWNLAHALSGLFTGDAAGALPAQDDQMDTFVERTISIYGRARRLARALADEHGAQTFSFWQTVPRFEPGTPVGDVAARLPAGTVDVSDVFDAIPREQIFIDEVHTNEEGARLMAERMWETLAPAVAAAQ